MESQASYVVGVDVGSSFIKCQMLDKLGNIKCSSSKEIQINIPADGHYELDPIKLWVDFQESFKNCLKKGQLSLKNIKAIGISVQRNSFLLWERNTSKPLTPIISWQDLRSSSSVTSWNKSWKLKMINYSSRLAYFFTRNTRYLASSILNFKSSLVSIRLYDLLQSDSNLNSRAQTGEICYGCIETWLLWCLTDGKEFSTDASCASVTGMYDPFTCEWSETLINLLHIPKVILPKVKNTLDNFGYTCTDFLNEGLSIPICCIIGDSQAATVGAGCFNMGEGKVTLGTGSFLNINTGNAPHVSMTGLYPEIGWKTSNTTTYLVEGYHPATGITIDWLKNLSEYIDIYSSFDGYLDFFQTYEELEHILINNEQNEVSTNDVHFVPAFMGLQVPINDPTASGMLIGLSPSTLKESIVVAVVEAIPMSIRWILDAVQEETGMKLNSIRVNGSVAKNKWILQRLSNITRLKIEACIENQTSCSGAAYLAGLHIGMWKSILELSDVCKMDCVFVPDDDISDKLDKKFIKWKEACERSRKWNIN